LKNRIVLLLAMLLLTGAAFADSTTKIKPDGQINDVTPLQIWEIEIVLDETGAGSYTPAIPDSFWGNLSQIDYRSSGLSGANTLTMTLNTSQVQLDSYNVTEGNTSRWGAVGLIADTIDFAITSGTANATITVDLFITR
jgi:type 1 fimbria pilin